MRSCISGTVRALYWAVAGTAGSPKHTIRVVTLPSAQPENCLSPVPGAPASLAVVGAGRLGTVIAAALRAGGVPVEGPLARGDTPRTAAAVLLCIPDAEIVRAAAHVPPGLLLGHCSGATGLEPLAGREAFSLHPLMTVPVGARPDALRGARCAVAGSSPRAHATARGLARRLGMRATAVADRDRAAASIASSFVVTLEAAAERLAATAGVVRELLAPLVRVAVDNWAQRGARDALTSPIVRGDELTVARQRAAVAGRVPELLVLWGALDSCTRALVDRSERLPA